MSITEAMINDFVSTCTDKGYQVKKKIGEGSFGMTFLGIRTKKLGPEDDGTCAIKLALDTDMLHDVTN